MGRAAPRCARPGSGLSSERPRMCRPGTTSGSSPFLLVSLAWPQRTSDAPAFPPHTMATLLLPWPPRSTPSLLHRTGRRHPLLPPHRAALCRATDFVGVASLPDGGGVRQAAPPLMACRRLPSPPLFGTGGGAAPSLAAQGRRRAAPSLVVPLEEKRKEAERSNGGARRAGAQVVAGRGTGCSGGDLVVAAMFTTAPCGQPAQRRASRWRATLAATARDGRQPPPWRRAASQGGGPLLRHGSEREEEVGRVE
uniref:Uncharacterized protein n=1 Tax=Arundo donax TaxID=35708 RepID=A0A0A9D3Z3_ARUDO